MEELNRRKAVVHVHPTAANCCRNLAYAPGVGLAAWSTAPTPLAPSWVITFSGDAARFPDIRFIWSHAGGTLPFLAARISGAASSAKDRLPNGLMPELKKFYYDLAGAANAGAIASLLQLVTPSQVLFGTDFPPGGTSRDVARAIAELPFFSPQDLQAIYRDNAVALLPRLRM